jgi:dipeptidyl aminopeptidase/acylaminoacyl peptidase
MAQPFDATRLQSHGEPLPVAQQLWLPPAPAQGYAAFSVSGNGVLAYQTRGPATTELVWFDRLGKRQGRVGEPGDYNNPAISADEKKLVVCRVDRQIGTRDIWVFDLASGTSSRFTFDPAEEINPLWSPDGSRIAFTFGYHGIYEKAATGTGDAAALIELGEAGPLQDWSPDGLFILYDSAGKLWKLPLSATESR